MYLSIRHTFTRQGVQKHHHFPLYMHATPLSTLNNTSSTHCLLFIKLKKLTQLPSVKPVTYMSDKKIILISQEANIYSSHLFTWGIIYMSTTTVHSSGTVMHFAASFSFVFPQDVLHLLPHIWSVLVFPPNFVFLHLKFIIGSKKQATALDTNFSKLEKY